METDGQKGVLLNKIVTYLLKKIEQMNVNWFTIGTVNLVQIFKK